MSRLPRLHSSPERHLASGLTEIPTLASTTNITTRARSVMANTTNKLKRKVEDDEALEAEDQPRKLPAISNPIQNLGAGGPLRPSRTATNLQHTRGNTGTSILAKSTGSGIPSKARATSAPPKNLGSSGAATSGPSATTRPRVQAGRAVSGGARRPITGRPVNDDRFQSLNERVTSIEAARAADAARISAEMDTERAKATELQANNLALTKELASARIQETTRRQELLTASDEIESLKRRHIREIDDLNDEARKRERELKDIKESLRLTEAELEREREAVTSLKMTVQHQSTAQITLSAENSVLQAQLSALKSTLDCKSADASQLRLELEDARQKIQELEEEVREAEMIRRHLHNTIQELKGNIRVFCRVRPVLPSESRAVMARSESTLSIISNTGERDISESSPSDCMARITFPDKRDHKEIVLTSSSESATGQERKETWNFAFDKVFEPTSTQSEVFEEISQLAQSCIDGYNVCIFAYGQTGSGKSYTMEGGSTNETAGMIPRAVEQVFRVAEEMKSKGWEYGMEGQFLEIYNETINDLLGKSEFDKKKHEIKHDKGSTRVTDAVIVPLSSASQVRSLLLMAQSRRSVAATLMNERSSRSHSVFTLRIFGRNIHSAESCEGSLNLVDLAGSERLNSSGAGNDKDRLKETQSINKSLSALADVIAALGEKSDKADKHIPYRNSKLTYLLQNSLSGNSKTLMVLNLSPLASHLSESLCSLRFATKVNNTTLGTAKRQTRICS